jgi:outer membrane protein
MNIMIRTCVSTRCAAVSPTRRFARSKFRAGCWLRLRRASLAALLCVLLSGGPISPAFAQNPPQASNPPQQNPPQANPGQQNPPVQNPLTLPTPQTPAQQVYKPALNESPIPVSLGVSKYDYSKAPRAFPNLIRPYLQRDVPPPTLTNSPRLDQLIHDNKLELTLQDAVELALENSMDVAVQRYWPWMADASILKAKTGQGGFQVSGAQLPFSTAAILPFSSGLQFDPLILSTTSIDDRAIPVNNPFLSGTGSAVTALKSHTTTFNNQFIQDFTTGTALTASWINTRSSSTSSVNVFNPSVSSSLTIGVTQELLNGFGHFVNTRNLQIAKNNRKIADTVFEQQAVTTITNTITAYWELVYARENVVVEQQAVAVSQKLYGDNQRQLAVGTMAPLDVTRAEAQLASDQQNLIVAQTVQLQDEQTLKNAISKDPLAANLLDVEIIPTDKPTPPEVNEAANFQDAMKEAFEKRPDLRQEAYNITNADIDARANKKALLPTASITAQYGTVGLAGNQALRGPAGITGAGLPIVDATGAPVTVATTAGNVPIFEPVTTAPVVGTRSAGFTTSNSQIFHNQFPDYNVSFNLEIPIRNRAAYADSQRALLLQRQLESQLQQLKNAAVLDVRNTYIALEQGRAQVQAATKSRELQQQTFDAEQKKYRLGASDVYNVILTQRDLVTAQGAELRALANLLEAKANYERAVGRTLEVNRVTIADAEHGEIDHDTLIPGTLHGKVVGTEELFLENGHR